MIQILHLNSDILILTLQCKGKVSESLIGERRGAYMVLVGKPKERRALGRPWRRWEDKIKMDLQDLIIIIIIIIIIFINCSWVVTRWQWPFYIV